MSDPTYKRTSGYRNWINRRCWLPQVRKGIAVMVDGQQYRVQDDGWRRLDNKGEGAK